MIFIQLEKAPNDAFMSEAVVKQQRFSSPWGRNPGYRQSLRLAQ